MIFWNVVKSEYRRVLSFLLPHYDDFSGNLGICSVSFKMLTVTALKLPTDFVICLC